MTQAIRNGTRSPLILCLVFSNAIKPDRCQSCLVLTDDRKCAQSRSIHKCLHCKTIVTTGSNQQAGRWTEEAVKLQLAGRKLVFSACYAVRPKQMKMVLTWDQGKNWTHMGYPNKEKQEWLLYPRGGQTFCHEGHNISITLSRRLGKKGSICISNLIIFT